MPADNLVFIGMGKYRGTWNAATNSGSLVDTEAAYGTADTSDLFTTGSGKGATSTNGGFHSGSSLTASAGDFFKVSVNGSSEIDGETGWQAGDYCVAKSGSTSFTWVRINQLDAVSTIAVGSTDSSSLSNALLDLSSSDKQILFNQTTTLGTSSFLGSPNLTFSSASNTVMLTGTLKVSGTVQANQFSTTIVETTILYKSGSTKFGDDSNDIHQFTGSLYINDNLNVTGTATFSQKISGTKGYLNNNAGLQVLTGTIIGPALEATTVSGSSTLQAVGNTTLGGTLSVSGSTTIANSISGSSTLQAVGNTTLGGTLSVSGSTTVANSISGSSTLQAVGNTTLGGTLNVSGSTTIASSISGSSTLQAVGNTTLGGTLNVSGTTTIAGRLTGSEGGYFAKRVGIGTATPAKNLHVNGASGEVELRLQSNDKFSSIVQKDNAELIIQNASAGDIIFYDDSAERMRIKDGGNVGIGTTSPSDTLSVAGTISGSSTLHAQGATTIGGTLGVTGSTTLAGLSATTISGSSTLQVGGNASLSSALNVTGAISGSSTLQAVGAATIGGALNVSGSTTIAGGLTAGAGEITLTPSAGGDVSVVGGISGSTYLVVVGNTTLGGTLDVSGTATLAGTTNAQAVTATTLSGSSTLQIAGAASLGNALNVTGAISGSSTLQAVGAATIGGALGVSGSTTLGNSQTDSLSVVGKISGSNTLQVVGATSLGSTLNVTGAISGSSTLQVVGNTVLGSNLNVTGTTTLAGAISSSAGAVFVNSLSSSGDIAITGAIHANTYHGDASNMTGLTALNPSGSNRFYSSTGLETSGYLKVSGSVTLAGTTNAQAITATTISGSSTLQVVGASNLQGDVTLSGSVTGSKGKFDLANGNLLLTGTLDVGGAATIVGNVDIDGTLSCDDSITIDSVTITDTELGYLDGLTLGTVAASKVATVDSNKDIGSFRNVTVSKVTGSKGMFDFQNGNVIVTGSLTATETLILSGTKAKFDFANGNLLLTGTLTTEGNIDTDGTLTCDTSLTIDSTTISAAEIGVLDSVTAGTVAADKAVIADSNKDVGTFRHVTVASITGSKGRFDFANGNILFTGSITGDGSGLTGLTATNISGTKGKFHTGNGNLIVTGTIITTGPITATDITGSKGRFDLANGNIIFTGSLNGDGSGLSNITATNISGSKGQFHTGNGNLIVTGTMIATGDVTIGGNVDIDGTLTCDDSLTIDSITITDTELAYLDGLTLGTVAASKVVTADSNKDVGTFRHVTVASITGSKGRFDVANGNLLLTGTLDVGGAATIVGNVDIDGTLSCDDSITIDSITITDTELGYLDGLTLGTVAASKVVTVDSNKDVGDFRHITAASLTGSKGRFDLANGNILFSGTIFGDGSGLTNITTDLNVSGNKGQFNADNGNVIVTGTMIATGDVTIGGNVDIDGTLSCDDSITIDSITITDTELGYLDGLTLGTVAASKVVTADSNKDVGTFRHVTVASITGSKGRFDVANGNLLLTGTLDVGGAATIVGNVDIDGTLSCDDSITIDSITITDTELGYLDGLTLGTVAASKVVTADSNKDVGDFRHVTVSSVTGSKGRFDITNGTLLLTGSVELGGSDIISAGQVSGSKGRIDLANGNCFITGTLEAGNLSLSAFSGDLEFASTNNMLSYNVWKASASGGLTVQNTNGNVVLDATGDVVLSADGDNITMDDGTVTVFDFNVADPTLKIMDDADTGDYFSINVAQHGATTITTVDDDAAAANLTFTIDGAIKLNGDGVEIENPSDSGAAALLIDNDDVDQIAIDIDAANTTADVIDITADAATTGHVIDITADALTTGAVLNIVSDSSTTDTRNLVLIHNDNTSATGASCLRLLQDVTNGAPALQVQGPMTFKPTYAQSNNSSGQTIDQANLINGIWAMSSRGTSQTDTSDTAANIIAAIPNCAVNDTFSFRILNGSSNAVTFAGGTGITNAQGSSFSHSIAAGQGRNYLFRITNVGDGSEAATLAADSDFYSIS